MIDFVFALSVMLAPCNIKADTGYTSPVCKLSRIKPNTQSVAFVFDLHDVLFKLNKQKAVQAFFACNQKSQFLNGVLDFAKHKLVSKDKENAKLCVENTLIGENDAVIDNALDILNAHEPINEMVNLVKDLKNAGYKIFLLSNIGERSCNYLVTKYKEVFDLFDDIIIPRKANGYITKSSIKIFKECETKVNKLFTTSPKIIMIDDSAKNIIRAESAGFIGVQFTSISETKLALKKFLK